MPSKASAQESKDLICRSLRHQIKRNQGTIVSFEKKLERFESRSILMERIESIANRLEETRAMMTWIKQYKEKYE